MANWISNGADTGGSGAYSPGSQSVGYILANYAVANGDTITLPTGTFNWSTGISCSKSITIAGSGYAPNGSVGNVAAGTPSATPGAPSLATVINWINTGAVNAIACTAPTTGNLFRLSGISFTGIAQNSSGPGPGYLGLSGSPTTDRFRVDNCRFDMTSFYGTMVFLSGNQRGLIDHCTFQGGVACEMIHNSANGAGNTAGWQDDIIPGSVQCVYIEDCIGQLWNYTTQTNKGATALIQNYYGARTCVRYTLLNFCHLDVHGTPGSVGGRWFEFYCNQLYLPSGITGNQTIYQLRGGSGIVFNTTVTGPGTSLGDTTSVYLFTDENPPYGSTNPPYGPGAGIFSGGATQGPASSPVYVWGNGTGVNAASTAPIAVNSNYFVSTTQPGSMTISEKASQIPATTYSYSPYTYPHPDTGLSSTPGTGLTAQTDLSITKTLIGVTSGAYSPPGNNWVGLFSTQFSNAAKAGAVEWLSSSDTTYVRQGMGASGAGWTISAYSSGVGVTFKNTNLILFPGVASNAQTLYSLGFLDSGTLGSGNINFFIDMGNNGQLSVSIGVSVWLPALTGAVFTTN